MNEMAKTKEIKDFDLKSGVDGQEDLLIQDNGITKRIKASEFLNTVDLTNYVTNDELGTKGFLTESDIANKVDKVEGMGLSTNDYTDIDKQKLSDVETGANKYIHPNTHPATMIIEDSNHKFVTETEKTNWNNKSEFDGDYNSLSNKPIIPTKTSDLVNDSNFIISIPSEYVTETELNAKQYATETFVTTKIADASLSGGEVDLSGYATKDELNAKANTSDLSSVATSGDYNDLINKPSIPTTLSQLTNDVGFATNINNTLETTDKTLIGAINELNYKVNKIESLTETACVYGVEVDFENLTFERLNEAKNKTSQDFNNIYPWSKMKRCNLLNGEITAWYGDENFVEDGTNGNVMVSIPKFYYKVVPSKLEKIEDGVGYHLVKGCWFVSEHPCIDFKVHPAFVRNGIEIDEIFVGAYEASIYDASENVYLYEDEQVADFNTDKIVSITNAKPCSGKTQNLTIGNARKLCENNGVGYSQMDFTTTSAIQLLLLIEYANFDLQTSLSQGVSTLGDNPNTENNSLKTGLTSALGCFSGYIGENGKTSVSYRGIENFWGNIWSFIDGVNIEGKGKHFAYWSNDDTTNNTDVNHKKINFTLCKTNGFVNRIGYDEDNDFAFLPTKATGASNKPCNDTLLQHNTYNGWLIALLGGRWNHGSNCGAFCWSLGSGSSDRFRDIGARLLYASSNTN